MEHERKIDPSWRTWVRTEWNWYKVHFRISLFRFAVWMTEMLSPFYSFEDCSY